MSILVALILGIVQGLTEFLPISSSGHLMLVEAIFGIEEGGLFFNVLVHFATLIAVVIVLWKDVVYIIKHPFSRQTGYILSACVPTVIIALIVEKFTDEYMRKTFLGFGFLISALVVFATYFLQRRRNTYSPLNYKKSIAIGVVQGLAVFPGVSRSASTICSSLMMGVEREEAGKFSFLISIPVIFGGMVFEIADGIKYGFGQINAAACIIGFISAFVVALFTIKLMMRIIKKGNWLGFAIYLILLAIFVILNQYVFMLF